jgi:hypothetical protein
VQAAAIEAFVADEFGELEKKTREANIVTAEESLQAQRGGAGRAAACGRAGTVVALR